MGNTTCCVPEDRVSDVQDESSKTKQTSSHNLASEDMSNQSEESRVNPENSDVPYENESCNKEQDINKATKQHVQSRTHEPLNDLLDVEMEDKRIESNVEKCSSSNIKQEFDSDTNHETDDIRDEKKTGKMELVYASEATKQSFQLQTHESSIGTTAVEKENTRIRFNTERYSSPNIEQKLETFKLQISRTTQAAFNEMHEDITIYTDIVKSQFHEQISQDTADYVADIREELNAQSSAVLSVAESSLDDAVHKVHAQITTILKEHFFDESALEEFLKFVECYSVERLKPTYLKHLIRYWRNTNYLIATTGPSACDVAFSLLEYIFECFTTTITSELPIETVTVPKCITDKLHLVQNFRSLIKLSEFAYRMTFALPYETSQIVDEDILESFTVIEILRKSNRKSQMAYFFVSKAIQHCLAALHIAQNKQVLKLEVYPNLSKLHSKDCALKFGDIFVYLCGICPNLANELSKWITTAIPHERKYPEGSRVPAHCLVQKMIIRGFKEAQMNDHGHIGLALNHFGFLQEEDDMFEALSDSELEVLKTLMKHNVSRVVSLHVDGCKHILENTEIENVLRKSELTLISLSLTSRGGCMNARLNKNLKYLYLKKNHDLEIEINVENLTVCEMNDVSESLEKNIIGILPNGPKVGAVDIYESKLPITCIASLKNLENLQNFHLHDSDLSSMEDNFIEDFLKILSKSPWIHPVRLCLSQIKPANLIDTLCIEIQKLQNNLESVVQMESNCDMVTVTLNCPGT